MLVLVNQKMKKDLNSILGFRSRVSKVQAGEDLASSWNLALSTRTLCREAGSKGPEMRLAWL